jgi:hypothetical protein
MSQTYVPGNARIGEPTPQTDPDLFTDAELKAEIRYLARLDKRYGVGCGLRALARVSLFAELAKRAAR